MPGGFHDAATWHRISAQFHISYMYGILNWANVERIDSSDLLIQESNRTLSAFNPYEVLLDIPDHLLVARSPFARTYGRGVSVQQEIEKMVPSVIFPSFLASSTVAGAQNPQILSVVLYLMSNKHGGSRLKSSLGLYDYVKLHADFSLFEFLVYIGGPTIEALAEQMVTLAIERQDLQMVERLLSSGRATLHPDKLRCGYDYVPQQGPTPLQRACELCSLDLVKVLLKAGADVNYAPGGSRPPLEIAFPSEPDPLSQAPGSLFPSATIELIKTLINAGAHLNNNILTPIIYSAAMSCEAEFVSLLLTAGAAPESAAAGWLNISSLQSSPLTTLMLQSSPLSLQSSPLMATLESNATLSDKVAVVISLIVAGTDVGHSEPHPIFWSELRVVRQCHDEKAYFKGRLEQELIQRRGEENYSPLICAILQSNDDLIKILMNAGAPVTTDALVASIETDRLHVVKLLLDSGAQINHRAIEFAVRNGNEEVLRILLEKTHGISHEAHLRCAFIEAIRYGNKDLINTLASVRLTSRRGSFIWAEKEATETALGTAARRGDVWTLRLLFSKDSVHRDMAEEYLDLLLADSIIYGHTESIELLFVVWSDLDAESSHGGLALQAAITKRDAEASLRLLELGAQPSHRSLREAVDWAYLPVISSLLENGPGFPENWGIPMSIPQIFEPTLFPESALTPESDLLREPPLVAAVRHGNSKIIRLLLAAGYDLDSDVSLTVAVEKGDREVVELLLAAGANDESASALEAAVRNDDINLVEFLLNSVAEVSEYSLVLAVHKSEEFVQTLLKWKLSRHARLPHGFGIHSLRLAIFLGKSAMIEAFLSSGVSTTIVPQGMLREGIRSHLDTLRSNNEKDEYDLLIGGLSAFGTAIAFAKDHTIVNMFLRNGADPSKILDEEGNTPLLAAVTKQDKRVVQLLLDAGANLNPRLSGGCSRTPLQKASETGSIELVHMLLEQGANINAPPFIQHGATALQFATIQGYLDIALLLIDKGADVNALPARVGGRTAIEGAAEHGRIDLAEILLRTGVRLIGEGSRQYEKALRLAEENGHMAVYRLLQRHYDQQSGYVDYIPEFDSENLSIGFGLEI